MHKPKSIAWFEALFLSGAAVSVLSIVIHWSALRAFAAANHGPEAVVPVGLAMAIAMNGFFWFFIVRRGSNAVKWLLCLVSVFAVIGFPQTIAKAMPIGASYAVLMVMVKVLQTLAPLLLFCKDARPWFAHRGRPPEPLPDVFG